MLRLLVSLAALAPFCAAPALSAPAKVSGRAADYAGRTLVFRAVADPVSRLAVDLEAVEVAPDGSFSFSLDVEEVTRVSVDLSSYEGHLYVEPGESYEVELPPFRLRPDAERFNPFYVPRQVSLKLLSATSELNDALARFDEAFARIYYPNAARLARRRDRALADRLLARVDSAAAAVGCDKQFFRDQVLYSRALVFATPRLAASRRVIADYYAGRPLRLNVPAYWETIGMLAPDILRESPYSEIRAGLAREMGAPSPDVAAISAIVAKDTLYADSPDLREALIVRSVAGAYYAKSITEGRADSMLISAARACRSRQVRLMAANVYAKKNKLRAGLPAPDFNLVDDRDAAISLATFRGRFLYLCFMHTENYECVKAMPALNNLAQAHRDNLDVLCVFTDDRADDAYSYVRRRGFYWRPVSFVADQRIVQDYEVRGLPTYFLIAPDGCIAMAQAPGPAENVGPAIAEAIRQYVIASKRGRPEVPRTIYDIANESRPN